ncbi:MAG: DUF4861 family protein [Candidatus Aminicenantes bacterium]|nr:DUF4861 family protein [Candidatus Aminicenantes bacterium]
MPQTVAAGKRLMTFIITAAVAAGWAAAQAQDPKVLGFKKQFVIEITNPSPLALENHAVVIDVAGIRASVAADFNTYNYALFDKKGDDYTLVVTQADDLDKDRYHDEIVLVRTLPPSSTTRLLCYYSPTRSFQLMPAQKAFARSAWDTGGAGAGWESNLAAFKFIQGRIEFYGKLTAGLILKKFPLPENKPQDWGMDVIDAGDSAGLGGLVLWDGATRVPLFGAAAPQASLTVLSPGPLRGLVKAEYAGLRTAAGEAGLTVFMSAFAESAVSRQDVVVSAKTAGPVVFGPGIQKLAGETFSLDKDKGFLAAWGKGAENAGEIGLAAIFSPADFAGMDETAVDRSVKLGGRRGAKLTYWVTGAWELGVTSPGVPAAKNWFRKVEGLAQRLLVPVKVEFKAK